MLDLGSGLRSWALLCFRAHCAYVCQRNDRRNDELTAGVLKSAFSWWTKTSGWCDETSGRARAEEVAELAFYIFAREVYETIPGVRELKHSAVMKIRQQKWDELSAAKKLVFEERAEAQVAEGEEEDRLLDIKLSTNFSAFAEFPIEAWWAALRRVRINSRSPHMPIKPRDNISRTLSELLRTAIKR